MIKRTPGQIVPRWGYRSRSALRAVDHWSLSISAQCLNRLCVGYIRRANPALQGAQPMATIAEQLQSYRATLAEAQAQGDQAIARKIEQQIKDQEDF